MVKTLFHSKKRREACDAKPYKILKYKHVI